eukprot:194514-Pelagomonas_calceolata.AAC.1
MPSRTLIHTLLQTVSPLFIKYINTLFTQRSTNNIFKGMGLNMGLHNSVHTTGGTQSRLALIGKRGGPCWDVGEHA